MKASRRLLKDSSTINRYRTSISIATGLVNLALSHVPTRWIASFSWSAPITFHSKVRCLTPYSAVTIELTLALALHIAGGSNSRLKDAIVPFIYALGTNTKLTELDVSGHAMGNKGVTCLAKILETNHALTTLYWDDNTTGLIGFLWYVAHPDPISHDILLTSCAVSRTASWSIRPSRTCHCHSTTLSSWWMSCKTRTKSPWQLY